MVRPSDAKVHNACRQECLGTIRFLIIGSAARVRRCAGADLRQERILLMKQPYLHLSAFSKPRAVIALLLTVCFLLPLTACAEKWDGYENADLSEYITLGSYKGVTYTKTEISVTDEEVDTEIDTVRSENMVKSELTDRAAEKGDYVILTYTTKVAEGTVSALSGKDKTYAVGSSYTLTELPGVSESLIGKNRGETYVFSLTFPVDYTNSNVSDITLVAGKDATVEIEITSLYEYVKPELNDEFVATVSEVSKTVAEYRAEIRAQLEEAAEEEARDAMQNEIWAAVLEGCTVLKYPKTPLETYREDMHNYYEEYASYYGYTLEQFLSSSYGYTLDDFEEKKTEYAESSVKSDLALYAVAAAEGLTVTEEEYQEGLQMYFELTGADLNLNTKEEFEKYYTREIIEQSLLWDEVIAMLTEHAVGVDKPQESETTASESENAA